MSEVVVGIDVGGTKIAAAVVGAAGELGDVVTVPTPGDVGADAILDAMATAATRAAAGAPIGRVGIGTAGVVDAGAGVIVSATEVLRGWKGTDVAGGMRTRLGLTSDTVVTVRNDVDAHALGECWLGAGRGAGSVLMVAVGTGVGGAVVLDGRLWTGGHHVAGEIAHVPAVGAEGLRCTCGRHGHLEALVAGPGMHRRYLALGGDPACPDGRDVSRRAAAGETLARDVVVEAATCLGRTLAGVATVLDPERIVIGGGAAGDGLWWEALERAFRADVIDALADTTLVRGELGPEAALVGAAHAAFEA